VLVGSSLIFYFKKGLKKNFKKVLVVKEKELYICSRFTGEVFFEILKQEKRKKYFKFFLQV